MCRPILLIYSALICRSPIADCTYNIWMHSAVYIMIFASTSKGTIQARFSDLKLTTALCTDLEENQNINEILQSRTKNTKQWRNIFNHEQMTIADSDVEPRTPSFTWIHGLAYIIILASTSRGAISENQNTNEILQPRTSKKKGDWDGEPQTPSSTWFRQNDLRFKRQSRNKEWPDPETSYRDFIWLNKK